MKKAVLLVPLLTTVAFLAGQTSFAQPWSVPVTNSTPQVRPPPANWIAAPKQGIKGRPVDFEYVRHEA
jgi:hypothetical protein